MASYFAWEEKTHVDALIVPLFEQDNTSAEAALINDRFHNVLSSIIEINDFEGEKGKQSLVYTGDDQVKRLLFVGLGKKDQLSVRRWKQILGAAVLRISKKKMTDISVLVPEAVIDAFGASVAGRETAAAIEIADYAYDEYKQEDARVTHIEKVALRSVNNEIDAMVAAAVEGKYIADGVNFARELGNTPPSIMTPALLAQQAKELAQFSNALNVTILEREDMRQLGMGCLLGVAQGSELPPKFIILEYVGGESTEQPTVLVGKGITFDSGGLSLKPANFMTTMKFDMLGAATVLGTFRAILQLGLKKNVVGLIPTCENMPSGSSYRPDDILVAMNGKSVEIGNTDAEGRLILADALSYAAEKLKPKEVIDFATLTGACVVALGTKRSGLFSNDEAMVSRMLEKADERGEQLWRLPLGEEYTEAMKSPVADIKNISNTRYGGASTAAAFLEFFTKDSDGKAAYPWAHIDLSSAHHGEKGTPYARAGATGDVVQTMIAYLN